MPTLKEAAKTIHDAYEAKLKGQKGLSVTHKSFGDGAVVVSITGTTAAVNSAYSGLAIASGNLPIAIPESTNIYSMHADLHEGPKAEKETDQTATLTLHHVISTH